MWDMNLAFDEKTCENFQDHICEIWPFVKFGSQMPSAINGVMFSWFNSLDGWRLEAFGESIFPESFKAQYEFFLSFLVSGRLWEAWEAFGVSKLILGGFGRLWETLGEPLGRLCEALGSFGRRWGSLWEIFGRLWEALGRLSQPFFSSHHLFLPYI